MLTGISAITLATHDMARAVAFYEALQIRAEIWWPNVELHQLSGRQRLFSTSCRYRENTGGATGAVRSSILLIFEITAACDEFPTTCRKGCVA